MMSVQGKKNGVTPITAVGNITGTAGVGNTLTAGATTPSNATKTYQWTYCSDNGGTYANIPNATSSTYTISSTYGGQYIKVVVTGTGSYSGTVTSNFTAQIVFYNVAYTGYFRKNNCSYGYAGSMEGLYVAANTYTSTVSQAAANTLAVNYVNANGQTYANGVGNCALMPTFNYQYYSLGGTYPYYVTMFAAFVTGDLGQCDDWGVMYGYSGGFQYTISAPWTSSNTFYVYDPTPLLYYSGAADLPQWMPYMVFRGQYIYGAVQSID